MTSSWKVNLIIYTWNATHHSSRYLGNKIRMLSATLGKLPPPGSRTSRVRHLITHRFLSVLCTIYRIAHSFALHINRKSINQFSTKCISDDTNRFWSHKTLWLLTQSIVHVLIAENIIKCCNSTTLSAANISTFAQCCQTAHSFAPGGGGSSRLSRHSREGGRRRWGGASQVFQSE